MFKFIRDTFRQDCQDVRLHYTYACVCVLCVYVKVVNLNSGKRARRYLLSDLHGKGFLVFLLKVKEQRKRCYVRPNKKATSPQKYTLVITSLLSFYPLLYRVRGKLFIFKSNKKAIFFPSSKNDALH